MTEARELAAQIVDDIHAIVQITPFRLDTVQRFFATTFALQDENRFTQFYEFEPRWPYEKGDFRIQKQTGGKGLLALSIADAATVLAGDFDFERIGPHGAARPSPPGSGGSPTFDDYIFRLIDTTVYLSFFRGTGRLRTVAFHWGY